LIPILSVLTPSVAGDAFEHDGQITKREVRAATLAALAPAPDEFLWDIGAGSGSIAIEWMRAARGARAIAFERHPERLKAIARNADRLGTPLLEVVAGPVPASLAGHPAPDAVFLGGAVADETVFAAAWAALQRGGRLVANAVTLESEAALIARQAAHGGELIRISIEDLAVIGGRRALKPRMAVLQWRTVKP
jgi:precorrin-6Y C5,15-methyltransferase (decarboxylating)